MTETLLADPLESSLSICFGKQVTLDHDDPFFSMTIVAPSEWKLRTVDDSSLIQNEMSHQNLEDSFSPLSPHEVLTEV